MKISIKFNQISIVRTTILLLPINTILGRDPPLDQTNKQGDAVVSLKACITTPVESLYAKSVRKGVRSGVLRRLKARTRDKSELIQRAVAKFPRLLRGHKLYSSNVNINETNELSVMPVMTVDCCQQAVSRIPRLAVVTTPNGPRFAVISINVYIISNGITLAMLPL